MLIAIKYVFILSSIFYGFQVYAWEMSGKIIEFGESKESIILKLNDNEYKLLENNELVIKFKVKNPEATKFGVEEIYDAYIFEDNKLDSYFRCFKMRDKESSLLLFQNIKDLFYREHGGSIEEEHGFFYAFEVPDGRLNIMNSWDDRKMVVTSRISKASIERVASQNKIIKNASSELSSKSLDKPKTESQMLNFKGLYIGMPINDAQTTIEKLTGYQWEMTVLASGQHYCFMPGEYNKFGIYAHRESGKVYKFVFSSMCVDKIFNVYELSAKDFAKAFSEAYKIPRLDIDGKFWTYKSPYGFSLGISANKELAVFESEKRSTDTKPKFD